jgi:hypothetical protein
MKFSAHAQKRMQQRNLNETDVRMILQYGTETKDGYFLRQRDVERMETELRTLITRLYRLSGKFVVVDGDTVVTSYHPTGRKQKRILRNRVVN